MPDRSMSTNRRVYLALSLLGLLSACAPKPPVLPYIAVGMYDGECGYDWNGAAFSIDRPDIRRPWHGSKDVALLIRFPPVDKDCVARAYKVLAQDGYKRIYVTSTDRVNSGKYGTPLMP